MASVELHTIASFTLSPGWVAGIGAGYFKPGQWCRLAVSLIRVSRRQLGCRLRVNSRGGIKGNSTVPYHRNQPRH